jgi:hypothetical protein
VRKMSRFPNELWDISEIYRDWGIRGLSEPGDARTDVGIGCGGWVEMEKSVAGHRYRLLFSS